VGRRDAQVLLPPVSAALGALRLLVAADQQLEIAVTALAGILE
jgi:hypothetical protein